MRRKLSGIFCILALLMGFSAISALAQPEDDGSSLRRSAPHEGRLVDEEKTERCDDKECDDEKCEKEDRCDKFKQDCKDLKKCYIIAKVLESKRMADMIAIDRIKKLAMKSGKPDIAKKPLIEIYEKSKDPAIKRIALFAASEILESAGDYEQAAAMMGKMADIKEDKCSKYKGCWDKYRKHHWRKRGWGKGHCDYKKYDWRKDCCDRYGRCHWRRDRCDRDKKCDDKKICFKECFINKGTIIVKVGDTKRCHCGPDCRCPYRMRDMREKCGKFGRGEFFRRMKKHCPLMRFDRCPMMRGKCDWRKRDCDKGRCDRDKKCDYGKKMKFERCFINKGTIIIKVGDDKKCGPCFKCPYRMGGMRERCDRGRGEFFRRMRRHCPTMRFDRCPVMRRCYDHKMRRGYGRCPMMRGKCDWRKDHCERKDRCDKDRRYDWRKRGCDKDDDACDRDRKGHWRRFKGYNPEEREEYREDCPGGKCEDRDDDEDDEDDRPESRMMLEVSGFDSLPDYITIAEIK